MDPEAALNNVLQYMHDLSGTPFDGQVREDLVESLEALTGWVAQGSFCPDPTKICQTFVDRNCNV